MLRPVARFLVCLALLFATACSSERVLVLSEWRLTPAAGGAEAIVVVPEHVGDKLAPGATELSLATRVALPPPLRGKGLTFAIPQLRSRCALFVGGAPMAPLDVEAGYRGSHHPRFRIPDELTAADALDLELRIERSWTQSEWLDTPPRLSATDEGDLLFRFVRGFNVATSIGALVTALFVGFSYAIVYALDRRKVAHGCVALEAFLALLYPAFQLGLTVPLFGRYDGAITAVSVNAAIVSSIHFSHAQFGLRRPHWGWDAPLFVCAAMAALFPGPFHMSRFVVPITIASISVNVVYQLALTAREWRRTDRPLHALVLVASWLGLGIFGAVDFIAWVGGGELLGLRAACLGIMGIATLQSAVLSRDHLESLKRSDALNAELAGRVELLEKRNREVDLLNGELRRQISARSEQIASALSRAGDTPSVPPRAFEPDEVVDGRYRIVRVVGEGGMGAVYEVRRVADDRRFALKLLTQARDGFEMARFAREAQIVAEITHPNVVSIVDIEIASSGSFYLVMEFVDGLSLRHHAARFADTRWALEVLRQMADGLAAVHACGIVHRDLKPANVLVAMDGDTPAVKIADFGISSAPMSAERLAEVRAEVRADAEEAPTLGPTTESDLTQTGVLMGTPKYMAPELASGAKLAKPSSDIFSFGVIAYELLTGLAPFREPPSVLRMMGISFEPPAPLCHLCPVVPARVGELLDRCLVEDPAARPLAAEIAAEMASSSRRRTPSVPSKGSSRSPDAALD